MDNRAALPRQLYQRLVERRTEEFAADYNRCAIDNHHPDTDRDCAFCLARVTRYANTGQRIYCIQLQLVHRSDRGRSAHGLGVIAAYVDLSRDDAALVVVARICTHTLGAMGLATMVNSGYVVRRPKASGQS